MGGEGGSDAVEQGLGREWIIGSTSADRSPAARRVEQKALARAARHRAVVVLPGETRRGSRLGTVQKSTVRWSNFDRRDPKMGVFLQSTEAIPCVHLLK